MPIDGKQIRSSSTSQMAALGLGTAALADGLANAGRLVEGVTALKTANYTVLASDHIILIGTLTGPITLTSPTPVAGQDWLVIDVNGTVSSTNTITWLAVSGTVNGASSVVIMNSAYSTSRVKGVSGTKFTAQVPAASAVTSVQTGYNYGEFLLFTPFPNQTQTQSTTFVSAGTFEFDPTTLTAANGTRSITLRIVASTTSPTMTVQLYNLTTAAAVTGSSLTVTATTPTASATSDLTSNLTNGYGLYQVQIKMASGGTLSDIVTLDMANLKVAWS